MSVSLPNKHCGFDGCYTVDFLPVTCNLCAKEFCGSHFTPDQHGCPSESTGSDHVESNQNQRIHCAFPGCLNSTPYFNIERQGQETVSPPNACPGCQKVFCLTHRHTSHHECSGAPNAEPTGPSKSQLMAQQAIKNAKAAGGTVKVAPTTNPAKAKKAAAVQLMVMRRKAEPANPRDATADVPVDQRLFVTVTHGPTEKILWTRKDIVTGKALDLFALKFGIYSTPLSLQCEGEALKNDVLLESQIPNPATLSIQKLNS
ncbi:hypothetical protein CPB86DRAFT_784298 [Serendipita vermifera]|nr:hypothetical protein CPB86DRAFT_784298 [Serendipita vermifera]